MSRGVLSALGVRERRARVATADVKDAHTCAVEVIVQPVARDQRSVGQLVLW
jgi:hypothetical protein